VLWWSRVLIPLNVPIIFQILLFMHKGFKYVLFQESSFSALWSQTISLWPQAAISLRQLGTSWPSEHPVLNHGCCVSECSSFNFWFATNTGFWLSSYLTLPIELTLVTFLDLDCTLWMRLSLLANISCVLSLYYFSLRTDKAHDPEGLTRQMAQAQATTPLPATPPWQLLSPLASLAPDGSHPGIFVNTIPLPAKGLPL
jgi:hypothetical protein